MMKQLMFISPRYAHRLSDGKYKLNIDQFKRYPNV